MVTRARQATGPRVALAVGDDGPGAELGRALEARGVRTSVAGSLDEAVDAGADAVAFALAAPPDAATAAALALPCARAARAERPVVALAAFEPVTGAKAAARASALAFMRANGAILCADPDVWLETIALVSTYGLPTGPRVAVVAPPGSWIALSAAALATEWSYSDRIPPLHQDAAAVGPADVALVDRSEVSANAPSHVGKAMVVPIVGRGESVVAGARVPLVGLRSSIDAAAAAGRCAERIAAGLGPAEPEDVCEDDAMFERQLGNLAERAGDHETKAMLKAHGVSITRQAVATTHSQATRIAKKAGWPVEVKPWSPDAPAEPDGGPVETEILNAPELRRSFVAVAKAAGLPTGSPVIVRETPPRGRELRARIRRDGALGWMVVVDVVGAPGPIAAPGPLRDCDAHALARRVEATRAGDPEPDRAALAELLRRASHMVAFRDDIFESIDLARIVVAPVGDGAVVVDARAVLRDRR